MKMGRKFGKYEVSVVELRMRERHHKRMEAVVDEEAVVGSVTCLLYTSPSPRDGLLSRMPSSA